MINEINEINDFIDFDNLSHSKEIKELHELKELKEINENNTLNIIVLYKMPDGKILRPENSRKTFNAQNREIRLTKREKEVLKLIVAGESNTEIADKLFISVHTAKAHVGNIMQKMGVRDRVKAAVLAVRNNII